MVSFTHRQNFCSQTQLDDIAHEQPRNTGQRARGCASRLGEYGGKLLTFSEEEIARFLPENITRTTKLQLDVCQLQFEEYLLNYKHCQGTDKFE